MLKRMIKLDGNYEGAKYKSHPFTLLNNYYEVLENNHLQNKFCLVLCFAVTKAVWLVWSGHLRF